MFGAFRTIRNKAGDHGDQANGHQSKGDVPGLVCEGIVVIAHIR
jgi:hypothetical protein